MRTTTLTLLVTVVLAAGAGADGVSDRDAAVRAAQVLAARRAWPEAVRAYQDAIAASPREAQLHNQLGICYQRQGDARNARRAYDRAISLNEAYAEAYNNIGTLEHSRGRYKEAIRAYRKAIEIRPVPAFYKNLGTAWLARDDFEQALAAWSEAVRLDPAGLEGDGVKVAVSETDLAKRYYLFAKVLAARGDGEKALDFLTKARAAGFRDFAMIERDRDFATLTGDPRYVALK